VISLKCRLRQQVQYHKWKAGVSHSAPGHPMQLQKMGYARSCKYPTDQITNFVAASTVLQIIYRYSSWSDDLAETQTFFFGGQNAAKL